MNVSEGQIRTVVEKVVVVEHFARGTLRGGEDRLHHHLGSKWCKQSVNERHSRDTAGNSEEAATNLYWITFRIILIFHELAHIFGEVS